MILSLLLVLSPISADEIKFMEECHVVDGVRECVGHPVGCVRDCE